MNIEQHGNYYTLKPGVIDIDGIVFGGMTKDESRAVLDKMKQNAVNRLSDSEE